MLWNFPFMSGSDVCISNFFTSSSNEAVGDESFLLIKILFRGLEELLHNFREFSSLISFRDSTGSTNVVVSLSVGLRLYELDMKLNLIYTQSGDLKREEKNSSNFFSFL